MHQIYSCNIIFIEYPNDFWHKRKIDNFDPYNVFLAIATNIPQRLKTGLVVQGLMRYVDLPFKNAESPQKKFSNNISHLVAFCGSVS